VEPEELSDVAENREVLRVLPGLLLRDPQRKAGVKINEKIINEIFDNIFSIWRHEMTIREIPVALYINREMVSRKFAKSREFPKQGSRFSNQSSDSGREAVFFRMLFQHVVNYVAKVSG